MDVTIKFQKLHDNVEIPKYETDDASGMDLCAFLEEDIELAPMERLLIPTGLKIEIPKGYEAQIRPRSGLSIKYGISLVNCVGTIDADYRGEVKIPLINLSKETFIIKNGFRVAQMVIAPVCKAKIEQSEALSETKRDKGGFGSTGI